MVGRADDLHTFWHRLCDVQGTNLAGTWLSLWSTCNRDGDTAHPCDPKLAGFFAEVYGENYGAVDGLNSGHGEPAWKQLDIYAQFVKAAMSTFSNCTNSFTCTCSP